MKNINFKKIQKTLFSLLVIFSFFLGTALVLAAGPDAILDSDKNYNDQTYTPLAPLPGFEEVTEDGTGAFDFSGPCPLGRYLSVFINVFIGIIAVISMIMIIMGGISYVMSDLSHGKGEAKSQITNAIFGLLIALSAYLILNTINPDLLNLCLDGIPKATITIDEDVPQTAVNGYYGSYKENAKWDDSIGKLAILPLGVKTNNPECTYVGQQKCTSTRGLNTSIINKIANGCWESVGKTRYCDIIINGGTENWLHSASGTHRPGSSTIDLSPTADVNRYITGKTTPPAPNTKKQLNGVTYYYHANHGGGGYHWHVY